MRKNRCIFTVLSLVLVLCALVGCAPLTGCSKEDFVIAAEEQGFTVSLPTGENISVVVADNGKYKILFYEYKDEKASRDAFSLREEAFDRKYHEKYMSLKQNSDNYNYYSFTANEEFHIISRVDNTLFFCEADKKYKDEILAFAEELGYR